MNNVKNGVPLKKIIDNNINRKVHTPPMSTKKLKIKICKKSSVIKKGNMT